MKYITFKEELVRILERKTGGRVDISKVEKNNGVTLEAVTIQTDPGLITPLIYLKGFYEEYEKGRTLEEIAGHIIRLGSGNTGEGLNWLARNFSDYEAVRDNISYRLVNYEKNAGLLQNMPHRRFLDLAIVYQAVSFDKEAGTGSILINQEQAESWGVTEETLNWLAQENTPKLFPAEVDSVGGILRRMGVECGFSGEELEEIGGRGLPLYTLTNTHRYMGAVCILYPDILQKISEIMKSDLFILPSSVHETLILPDDGIHTVGELKEMVHEVNVTQVAEEEFLSDGVYRYENGRGLQLM